MAQKIRIWNPANNVYEDDEGRQYDTETDPYQAPAGDDGGDLNQPGGGGPVYTQPGTPGPSARPLSPSAPPTTAPSAPSAPAPSAGPTALQQAGVSEPRYRAIEQAYQQYLGRAGGPDEVMEWTRNPYALSRVIQAIQESPEAQAYTARTAAPAPAPAAAPGPAAGRTTPTQAPPGYRQEKWADPEHQTPKYKAGRIIAAGGSIQDVAAAFPGARVISEDKVDIPGFGIVDVIRDVEGAHAPRWGLEASQGKGGNREALLSQMAGGGAVTGQQGGKSPFGGYSYDPQSGYQFGYTGGAGGAGNLPPELARFYTAQTQSIQQRDTRDAEIRAAQRDALLRIMAQGQEAGTAGDTAPLGPAGAAYRTARTRESGREREQLAERAAFMGLNPGGQGSGAFEAGIQGIGQQASEDIAGYESQLALNEMQSRRTMLMQALQMADALGARTESQELQRELAQLDASLRQQQLGFNYAGLGQQQSNWEDQMGLSYNQLLSQMNRDALLASMGR